MKIRWLYIILAFLTVTMTVEPWTVPVAASEDACCAEVSQIPACGDDCQDEGCEKPPVPDNCPNKDNPFQICGCCNTFVLHTASNILFHLTPAEPRPGNMIAFYQAPPSSAALKECWRPPRA